MKFYSYKGHMPLGSEPCGTEGKSMDELKTVQGVVNRLRKCGWVDFNIYTYSNFYDRQSFKLVYQQ